MVAYVLFIYSEGDVGIQYWKFGFPGAVIGSFFNNIATTCVMWVPFPPLFFLLQ